MDSKEDNSVASGKGNLPHTAAFSNIKVRGKQNTQTIINFSKGKGNVQAGGNVTIHNHYSNAGFEALLAAYLELQAKYIALLESKSE
jgi:hypothetical protein